MSQPRSEIGCKAVAGGFKPALRRFNAGSTGRGPIIWCSASVVTAILLGIAVPLAAGSAPALAQVVQPSGETAEALDAKGNAALSQGRVAEAEALFKRALTLREKKYGRDHPEVAKSLENLAKVYARQNRTAEAQALLKRAAEIRQKSAQETAKAPSNFGQAYRKAVRPNENEAAAKSEPRRDADRPGAGPGIARPNVVARGGIEKDGAVAASKDGNSAKLQPAPPPAARNGGGPAVAPAAPPKAIEAAKPRPPLATTRSATRSAPRNIPTDPAAPSAGAGEVSPKSDGTAGALPPPAPLARSRGTAGKDGAQPPPPTSPRSAAEAGTPDKADWQVVPVFFGTDRARTPNVERVDYGYDRGRRLELGRALVTVPKSHIVPQLERPWAIKIPYTDIVLYEEAEDPKRHFTIKELKSLSREEFLALVRERLGSSSRFKDHAVVFVHGYNTRFDSALYRTAQIAYDVKFDGAPFLYTWPSGGGVASYTYDRESAGQAEPYFREFLEMVSRDTGAKSISIIAHSMGNQLLLRVLQDMNRSTPPGVTINQLILAAPDVDRDNFENIAKALKGIAKGITLYAAANDRALDASRRFNGGIPRAGDVPLTGPMVVPGLDTIDVTAVSTDSLGINHSGYAENNALLNDVGLLIQTGEHPPEKRIPILQRVPTARGDYWRYPVSSTASPR